MAVSHAVSQCAGDETIVVAARLYDTALGEVFPITIGINLAVEGEGAGTTTIDADESARVFTVNAGMAVTISGVTITGGATASDKQGAYGGDDPGGDGGDGGSGGGIYNAGRLNLTNSTVSGNSTGSGSGGAGGSAGGGGLGGGIYNAGVLTVSNNTVSNNTTGDGSPGGSGGGIYNADGFFLSFKSTIIAGNTTAASGPDCYGSLTSIGCNLVQDITDCTIEGDSTGNIIDEDPRLGPMADNGGPTETHALQPDSPATDAIVDCECTIIDGGPVNTDQRGQPRPMDGDDNGSYSCDIGAYEAPGPIGPQPLSPYEQGYQDGYGNGYQAGYSEDYQAGLKDCPSGKTVGGNVFLIDKIELLLHWIVLAILAMVIVTGGIYLVRRRVHN